MRYSAPPGTHDILPPALAADSAKRDWPDDIDKWHWLEGIFRNLCGLYGYEEVRTPVFEQTDLFKRAVGEGTDIVSKETYDFIDRGNRSMTLRPEGTAPALRAYLQHRLYIDRPVCKLYYVSSIYRYERKQKGRYREHHQVGIEVLGAAGPDIDAEVIALATSFFTRLGITRLTLKLNSVGTTESREKYVEALRSYAEPLLSEMSEDNQRRFQENALRMLDSKSPRDQELLSDAPLLTDYLDDESRRHFEELQGYLTGLGIDYELDPRLVRGFDYYTRTAFEIQSPDVGSQSALAGGGRYDKLVKELGGPPTPGIGFGLGIERALIALQTAGIAVPEPPGLMALLCPLGARARSACVHLVAQMRAANMMTDMVYSGRKLNDMLEQADKRRARYALIVGDDEIEDGVVQVRDMRTKQQVAVSIAHVAETLRGAGASGGAEADEEG